MLLSMKVTTTVLAHTTKESSGGKPFGSAFWHNSPRATFEIVARKDTDLDEIDIGIYNRKSNNSRLAKPIGLKLYFGCPWVMFEKTDIQGVPELAEKTTAKDQLRALYRRGSYTIQQAAEETGLAKDTVRRTNDRDRDRLFIAIPGTRPAEWANKAV